MKRRQSLGFISLALCALVGLGCRNSHPRPPAPIISISVRSMLIKFAHLDSPPSMKVARPGRPKVESEPVSPRSKVAQARNFVATQFKLPQWVVEKVTPEATATAAPRKSHPLTSTAPTTSGDMGKVYATIKDSKGKADSSRSEDVIGIQ